MSSITLADATDLTSWANRRDAQDQLPRVLRRLVQGSIGRVLRVGFPAGEDVQLGGWDGIVVVEQGNAFVPDGFSAWELGTNKDVKRKADGDYEKRCNDPRGTDPAQSTFVFATPRRWGGKDNWVIARQKERLWREVRAYDASDLETWLELAPAVHLWLSVLIGKLPEDVIDLGNFWADWSETTRPRTSAEFVLAGRKEIVQRLQTWLRDSSALLSLQADTHHEALGVFAAVIHQLPAEEKVSYLSRAVVVRTPAAWHRLTASPEPLILIQDFDSCDTVSRAVRAGHRVVLPLGRSDSASASTVIVPRLTREEAAQALIAAGITEDRARYLATLARRSLTSFRRKLALSPEVQQPEWACPANARHLLPVMFAGAWSDAQEGDLQALAALANTAYAELSHVLVRWSNEADPPLRHVGDAWFLTSKEDAWSLLARNMTRDDMGRLQQTVLDVLGTPDPRFDLPENRRWMGSVLGHAPRHSALLREGLADTLAIMGARGENTLLSAGVSAADQARAIVKQLLVRANADWRLWASLSQVLPLIAEAAPDAFLGALEEGLAGQQPVVLQLFSDRQGTMFSSSPHTGLLWALETLAWSPEYIGRAVVLLAKLARLDPGGHLANRPQASLRDLFLLWHPQTSASLEQRLRVLDTLRMREPQVAWTLLRQLLPEAHSFGRFTPQPRWRDWAPDSLPTITVAEYSTAIREITTRMLSDVGVSGSRWQDLIFALPTLPPELHDAIVEHLAKVELDLLQDSDRNDIWHALRQVISKHRSRPTTNWALSQERVNRLEATYRRFEPQELMSRYAWLFAASPDLLEGRKYDWKADCEALALVQLDAIHTIHAQGGLPSLLAFLRHIEEPRNLGFALGYSEVLEGEEDDLLHEHLAVEDFSRSQFAWGFANGRVNSRGYQWIEAKLAGVAREWSPSQRAVMLTCLPAEGHTWDLAAEAGAETDRRYWQLIHPFNIINVADIARAARRFLDYGRCYAAVDILGAHAGNRNVVSPVVVADILERALHTVPDGDHPLDSTAYHVGELLNVIDSASEIEASRIARLEWGVLPLLGHHGRKPSVLYRELAQNPEFFTEVLALVFRAEGEEPHEATQEEVDRARRGYDLLTAWDILPGTGEDGLISADILTNWIQRARDATMGSGREAIGDQQIGRILSCSPVGADGIWPHPAVCDVIENVASTQLESGFEMGVYNSRGCVSKQLGEGGVQERQLADRYATFAAVLTDCWPRTAAMLRRIAECYRSEARREDQEAELEEDLRP